MFHNLFVFKQYRILHSEGLLEEVIDSPTYYWDEDKDRFHMYYANMERLMTHILKQSV